MDELITHIQRNAFTYDQELAWFSNSLDIRFQLYFEQESGYQDIYELPPPILETVDSNYAQLVQYYQMSAEERLLLMLALTPNLSPQALDVFFVRNTNFDRPFTEFGGLQLSDRSGFFPTGETALFLLAGSNTDQRIFYTQLLQPNHFFFKAGILQLSSPNNQKEGELYHMLSITPEYLHLLTSGTRYTPEYSSTFPAKPMSTPMEWEDLILAPHVLAAVNEIRVWIEYQQVVMQDWGLSKQLKPGYRTLFYGPPGTGKTLTASLLGKVTAHPVFRVDLSLIVSKFIGETEKNLANIFDQAANKNWILFFDEADALFGKRTQTSDAKDRYANQETAYLLQKIEDFPGVIILATNLKKNMDKAFSRRFQSIIHFPMPDEKARFQLWTKVFGQLEILHEEVDFKKIAKAYEISGGSINNVLRYCSLQAVQREIPIIFKEDIIQGIRREYAKEGKVV